MADKVPSLENEPSKDFSSRRINRKSSDSSSTKKRRKGDFRFARCSMFALPGELWFWMILVACLRQCLAKFSFRGYPQIKFFFPLHPKKRKFLRHLQAFSRHPSVSRHTVCPTLVNGMVENTKLFAPNLLLLNRIKESLPAIRHKNSF